jgi:hypothetical protein
MAIEVLIERGVPEDHILFLNLIASPEGAKNFAERFPKVRVVTAFIDQGLDDKKYVPNLYPPLVLTVPPATSCPALVTLAIASIPCEVCHLGGHIEAHTSKGG